jgi:hypothetical protein
LNAETHQQKCTSIQTKPTTKKNTNINQSKSKTKNQPKDLKDNDDDDDDDDDFLASLLGPISNAANNKSAIKDDGNDDNDDDDEDDDFFRSLMPSSSSSASSSSVLKLGERVEMTETLMYDVPTQCGTLISLGMLFSSALSTSTSIPSTASALLSLEEGRSLLQGLLSSCIDPDKDIDVRSSAALGLCLAVSSMLSADLLLVHYAELMQQCIQTLYDILKKHVLSETLSEDKQHEEEEEHEEHEETARNKGNKRKRYNSHESRYVSVVLYCLTNVLCRVLRHPFVGNMIESSSSSSKTTRNPRMQLHPSAKRMALHLLRTILPKHILLTGGTALKKLKNVHRCATIEMGAFCYALLVTTSFAQKMITSASVRDALRTIETVAANHRKEAGLLLCQTALCHIIKHTHCCGLFYDNVELQHLSRSLLAQSTESVENAGRTDRLLALMEWTVDAYHDAAVDGPGWISSSAVSSFLELPGSSLFGIEMSRISFVKQHSVSSNSSSSSSSFSSLLNVSILHEYLALLMKEKQRRVLELQATSMDYNQWWYRSIVGHLLRLLNPTNMSHTNRRAFTAAHGLSSTASQRTTASASASAKSAANGSSVSFAETLFCQAMRLVQSGAKSTIHGHHLSEGQQPANQLTTAAANQLSTAAASQLTAHTPSQTTLQDERKGLVNSCVVAGRALQELELAVTYQTVTEMTLETFVLYLPRLSMMRLSTQNNINGHSLLTYLFRSQLSDANVLNALRYGWSMLPADPSLLDLLLNETLAQSEQTEAEIQTIAEAEDETKKDKGKGKTRDDSVRFGRKKVAVLLSYGLTSVKDIVPTKMFLVLCHHVLPLSFHFDFLHNNDKKKDKNDVQKDEKNDVQKKEEKMLLSYWVRFLQEMFTEEEMEEEMGSMGVLASLSSFLREILLDSNDSIDLNKNPNQQWYNSLLYSPTSKQVSSQQQIAELFGISIANLLFLILTHLHVASLSFSLCFLCVFFVCRRCVLDVWHIFPACSILKATHK